MSPPWMPLYIADYLADTRHLSAAEHGAYLLLIMAYWQRGDLPTDDRQLARLAAMSDKEWKAARPTIATFFANGWRHGRIDRELVHSAEVGAKRRAAAEARYSKRDANAAANAGANEHPPDLQTDVRSTSFTREHNSQLTTSEASASSVEPRKRGPPAGRGTRIDPNWQMGAAEHAVATEEGLSDERGKREFDRMRDHFLAAPGERGRKADWLATWRNWCRKAADGFGSPGGHSSGGNGQAPGGRLGAYQRAAGRFPAPDDVSEHRADVHRGPPH